MIIPIIALYRLKKFLVPLPVIHSRVLCLSPVFTFKSGYFPGILFLCSFFRILSSPAVIIITDIIILYYNSVCIPIIFPVFFSLFFLLRSSLLHTVEGTGTSRMPIRRCIRISLSCIHLQYPRTGKYPKSIAPRMMQ